MEQRAAGSAIVPLWQRCQTWAVVVWVGCLVGVSIRVALKPGCGSVYPCYTEAGRRWLADEPVYQDPHGYRYSPPVTPVFAALSLLPDRVGEALWRLLSAGVYLSAIAWWVPLLPKPLSRPQKSFFFLLVVPLSMGSLNNGQANLLVTGLLVGGVAAVARSRWNIAAGCLAVPCLLKVYPGAIGLLLLVLYPRKLAPRLLAVLALGLALPFLLEQPERGLNHYRAWLANLAIDDRSGWPLEYGYRDLWQLCRLLALPVGQGGYRILQIVAAAGVAAMCLACRHAGWRSAYLLTTALALGSSWMMLFGPATESSTFVMLAPSIAWAVSESWIDRRGVWTRVALALSYGLFLAAFVVTWFPFVLRVHALGLHAVATLIFFGVSLSMALANLRRSTMTARAQMELRPFLPTLAS